KNLSASSCRGIVIAPRFAVRLAPLPLSKEKIKREIRSESNARIWNDFVEGVESCADFRVCLCDRRGTGGVTSQGLYFRRFGSDIGLTACDLFSQSGCRGLHW